MVLETCYSQIVLTLTILLTILDKAFCSRFPKFWNHIVLLEHVR